MSPRYRRQRPARADARLLELVARFTRLRLRIDALIVREDRCDDWEADGAGIRAEQTTLVSDCWRIRKAVCAIQAHTPPGLAAKASIALWEFYDPADHPDVAISRSLAVDVMRRAVA